MARLTKRFVDSLKPSARPQFYWDEDLRGFGVRVRPSGGKFYVVQYRVRGSRKSKRRTLGATNLLSPQQARDRALRILADAAAGHDSAEPEDPETPDAGSFAAFATRFLEEHSKRRKKTWAADADYLDRLILPALGALPLDQVDRDAVARLHARIGDSAPYAANRALALIATIYTKALEWGVLPPTHGKPTQFVRPFPERKRQRFLSIEEVVRLGEVLRQLELEAEQSPFADHPRHADARLDSVAIIRLAVLTACRKMEICGLAKSEIDRERQVARLQDSKTGPKIIELPPPALAVIDRVNARGHNAGSPWIFPAEDRDRPRGEPRRLWNRARERSGLLDVRLHDLRRTYASIAASVNVPPAVLQGLLGHAKYETTDGYVQLFDRARASSAERVAGMAAALLEGRPDAEVIALRDEPR